MVHNHRFTD